MGFKDKLKAAKRGTRDVDVLLDRTLLAEREPLLAAVRDAEAKAQKDARLASKANAAAKALNEFNERASDELVTVRVVEVSASLWRQAQMTNPMQKVEERRSHLERRHGFDVLGAAWDAITEASQIVEDGEVVTPTAAEWDELGVALNGGDMARLANAVLNLQEGSGLLGYDDVKKA